MPFESGIFPGRSKIAIVTLQHKKEGYL